MQTELRGWFVAAWACLTVLVALTLWAGSHCIVICGATLSTAPEPDGWLEWPPTSYAAISDGDCPDDAYGPNTGKSIRRDPGSDLYVIATDIGARPIGGPREHFVRAVRREAGRRVAYRSDDALMVIPPLGLALGVMIAGLGVARRRLRAGALIAASMRDTRAALASESPTYRTFAAGSAPIHGREARLASSRGASGAKRALVFAFVTLFAIFALTLIVGNCFVSWSRMPMIL